MIELKDIRPGRSKHGLAFFLSFDDKNRVQYQGVVNHLRADGTGVCKLFSWFDGSQTNTLHATAAFFEKCQFYASDYEMRCAAEKLGALRG